MMLEGILSSTHCDNSQSESCAQQSINAITVVPSNALRKTDEPSSIFNVFYNHHSYIFDCPKARVPYNKTCLISDYLCLKRVRPLDLRFHKHVNVRESNRKGIRCIRFDGQNQLFAVGGANGVIQVFDFNSCLTNVNQHINEHIIPVATVLTRREISDVKWSMVKDDDSIAVSFFFYSQVCVFDLSSIEDPITNPSRFLNASRESAGGNNVLLFDKQFIIAGGVNGYIRMWHYSPNFSVGSSKNATWEIPAVPVAAVDRADPVVGLVSLYSDCNSILSMTRSGVACIWNISQMKVQSFSGSMQPTLVRKLHLWENIPYVSPSAIIGITQPHLEEQHVIAVTTGDGRITLLNLLNNSTSFDDVPSNHTVALSLTESSESQINPSMIVESRFHASKCISVFPYYSGMISCNGVHGTDILQFKVHNLIQCKRASSYRSKNVMQVCPDISFTLPGYVVSVEEGGRDVSLSHELHDYLVATSISKSISSKSATVQFDLIHAHHDKDRCYKYQNLSGLTYSVFSVCDRVVSLVEPYGGPSVVDGEPRVLLRTNLVFRTCTDDENFQFSDEATKVVFEIDLGHPITALEVCPIHPDCIIAGLSDDSLIVLSSVL